LLGFVAVFCGGCGENLVATAEKPASDTDKQAGKEDPNASHTALPAVPRKPRVDAPQEFGDPRATVEGFLTALSRRNETQVAHLLSQKARDEAASHGFGVRALGSDSARFKVGVAHAFAFETGGHGAEVACTWHDKDEQGAPQSFTATWILRQEEGQWRVAGMKAPLPGSSTTVVLNFEDFASMEANQRLAEAEINGRPAESTAAAGEPSTRQR